MYSDFFIPDTMFLRWEVAAKNFRFNKWEKFFDRKDPPNKLFTLLKKLGCLQYWKFFLWTYTSPTLIKILVYLLILFLEIPWSVLKPIILLLISNLTNELRLHRFFLDLFASVVLDIKNWCKRSPLVRLLMRRRTRLEHL